MHQADEPLKLLVLGTAQDGGYPHTGCSDDCCQEAWKDESQKRMIASLAVLSGIDCFLFDITPDFKYQLQLIGQNLKEKPRISGIFITHAHSGHYTGLLELGLEVMNTDGTPVYVMQEMKVFLEENAPFTQLIKLNNIKLQLIEENSAIQLNENISITPFQVPHRNEFSETVGYKIQSLYKSLLYIPDIDSWDTWDVDINDLIQSNDILLLDGTFFSDSELSDRNVQDVPHPFIQDSLQKFSLLEEVDRKKVYFTHLNHTNPAIRNSSPESLELLQNGCHIADDGMMFRM